MKIDTKNPLYVVVFSLAASVLFTAAIMLVQVASQGAIDRNQKLLEQKALLQIFQMGDPRTRTMELRDPATGRTMQVVVAHQGQAGQSPVLGYAVPIEGMGFWDLIRGYIAVGEDLKRVTGIAFLRQAETPGLGGEIMSDQWRQKWQGLEVSPPPEGRQFVYIGGSAPDNPQDPRQGRFVEAITGATGTSLAVERFVNQDLAAFQRAAREAGLGGEGADRPSGQNVPPQTQADSERQGR